MSSVLPSSTTTISCGYLLQLQFQMQVLDGGGDAALFVARRDHDGQQRSGAAFAGRGGDFTIRSPPASRDVRAACCAMSSRDLR